MTVSDLTDLELMSIHKAIHTRLVTLDRDIKWYARMSERNTEYVTKLAIAQTEQATLLTVKELTSKELTLRHFAGKI